MAIPATRHSYGAPPLPPPRLVPIDGPVDPNIVEFKERRRHGNHNSSPGNSLGLSFERRDLSFKREREFSDEGYQSIDSLKFVGTVWCRWYVLTDFRAGPPRLPFLASRPCSSFTPTAALSTT